MLRITSQLIVHHFDRDPFPLQITDLAIAVLRENGAALPEQMTARDKQQAAQNLCYFTEYKKLHLDLRRASDVSSDVRLVTYPMKRWRLRYGWEGVGQFAFTTSHAADARAEAYAEEQRLAEEREKAGDLARRALAEEYPQDYEKLFNAFMQALHANRPS